MVTNDSNFVAVNRLNMDSSSVRPMSRTGYYHATLLRGSSTSKSSGTESSSRSGDTRYQDGIPTEKSTLLLNARTAR